MVKSCQNHVKDKKMSSKLETLLTRVSYEYVHVSVSDTYQTRDTPSPMYFGPFKIIDK